MQKVLIVEDDESLRNVFGMIVKTAGYKVALAQNGEEGLEQLQTFSPDVVLLDMLMPVKSGLEFLQEANIKNEHPNTIVIILSNLSESQTIEEGLKLGAVRHLVKSNILPNDLLSVIGDYTGSPTTW